MLAIFYATHIRCHYVHIHVHTFVVTGFVGYHLHYLWCVSVAQDIQRPITVWLMNKNVSTRATVGTNHLWSQSHTGKWSGRTHVAQTSQARPASLRWILPHQEHHLYSFLVPLWLLRTLSYDCLLLQFPKHKDVSKPLAGRTTARPQESPSHPPVTRLKGFIKKQWVGSRRPLSGPYESSLKHVEEVVVA